MYKNGEYLEKNPTWHAEDSFWKAEQIVKMMDRNHICPKSVCEIGCGAGEILRQLSMKLPSDTSFVGYEISPQAFNLCVQKNTPGVQFFLKDPSEDNLYFDLVLAMDVIEHVEDYYGFLKRVQKKGKYKVFHVPLQVSVQSLFNVSSTLESRNKWGHIHYFSKETIIAALNDSGYKVLDHFYTASSVDFPADSFKSKCANLIRKMMYKITKDFTVRLLGGYSLLILAE